MEKFQPWGAFEKRFSVFLAWGCGWMQALKETLQRHGYQFESDTDTEVIPKLAKYLFDKYHGKGNTPRTSESLPADAMPNGTSQWAAKENGSAGAEGDSFLEQRVSEWLSCQKELHNRNMLEPPRAWGIRKKQLLGF